jgi:hypothetical protein
VIVDLLLLSFKLSAQISQIVFDRFQRPDSTDRGNLVVLDFCPVSPSPTLPFPHLAYIRTHDLNLPSGFDFRVPARDDPSFADLLNIVRIG